MRRVVLALLLTAVLPVLGGCGSDNRERLVEQVRTEVRAQVDEAREALRAQQARIRARVEEFLGELEQVVPKPPRTLPQVQARGRTRSTEIDAFLQRVVRNIDSYWTRTLTAAGRPEPRVGFVTIPPGRAVRTGCGETANDQAAFYCPGDDTIYVGQAFAAALYRGVSRGLPGQEGGGVGPAGGDFGVAYVLAHEYAHDLQAEFGVFELGRSDSAKPFELQADCLAGTYASSAFASGAIDREDVNEAIQTALAVGDFDVSSANHHGTPVERRDALLTGFRSGDPNACAAFVPAAA